MVGVQGLFQLGLCIPIPFTEVKLLRNWEKGVQSHLPWVYSNLEWQHWIFWATLPVLSQPGAWGGLAEVSSHITWRARICAGLEVLLCK